MNSLHNSIFFKKYVWDQGWVDFRNTGNMPIFLFSEVKCKSESGSWLLMCSTDIKIEFILFLYLEPTYAFTYIFSVFPSYCSHATENFYLASPLPSKQMIFLFSAHIHVHCFSSYQASQSWISLYFLLMTCSVYWKKGNSQ